MLTFAVPRNDFPEFYKHVIPNLTSGKCYPNAASFPFDTPCTGHRVQQGWVSPACFRALSKSSGPLASLAFCKKGLLFLYFLKNIPTVREQLAIRVNLCTLRPLERRSSRNSPGLQWPPAPAHSTLPLLRSLLRRSPTGSHYTDKPELGPGQHVPLLGMDGLDQCRDPTQGHLNKQVFALLRLVGLVAVWIQ